MGLTPAQGRTQPAVLGRGLDLHSNKAGRQGDPDPSPPPETQQSWGAGDSGSLPSGLLEPGKAEGRDVWKETELSRLSSQRLRAHPGTSTGDLAE